MKKPLLFFHLFNSIVPSNHKQRLQSIETGVEELDEEKLPKLLELKYHTVGDGAKHLGGVDVVRETFLGFQKVVV